MIHYHLSIACFCSDNLPLSSSSLSPNHGLHHSSYHQKNHALHDTCINGNESNINDINISNLDTNQGNSP